MAARAVVCALLLALAVGATSATRPRDDLRAGALKFKSIVELESEYTGSVRQMDLFVEGFDPAESPSAAFPGAFWASELCSATLVGPQVLVTAAHCFKNNPYVEVTLANQVYTGECVTAAAWLKQADAADVALCKLCKRMPVASLEAMALDVTGVKRGDPVLLTGFGGSAVARVASGTHLAGTALVERVEGNVLVTQGGAWLTRGDSGGGGYLHLEKGRRVLISVNSSVESKDKSSRLELLSGVKAFLTGWAHDNGVEIRTVPRLADHASSREAAFQWSLRRER
jgi:hypothetical protein